MLTEIYEQYLQQHVCRNENSLRNKGMFKIYNFRVRAIQILPVVNIMNFIHSQFSKFEKLKNFFSL